MLCWQHNTADENSNSKGLWSAHIEQTMKEARQRLGAINWVKQYLRDEGVCIAYKAFVCSKLEYENLIYSSATEIHLAKLDRVQQQTQRLFEGVDVPSLEQRREAAAIGLTCRLMSGNVKQPLNMPAYVRKCETATQTPYS